MNRQNNKTCLAPVFEQDPTIKDWLTQLQRSTLQNFFASKNLNTDQIKLNSDLKIALQSTIDSIKNFHFSNRHFVDNAVYKDIKKLPDDFETYHLEPGDVLIFASDGITDNFTPKELLKIWQAFPSNKNRLFIHLFRHFIKNIIAAGLGFISKFSVRHELKSGRLVQILPKLLKATRPFYWVYASEEMGQPDRTFLEFASGVCC